jgi:hypothetical protein
MSSLERALIEVARTLSDQGIAYMVIGGLANAVWGEARATVDIDVTVWVVEDDIPNVISLLEESFRPVIEDPVTFVRETGVLPLETEDGVRIDLIFGKLPYEKEAIERAVLIKIAGQAVSFCTPEDLILHKIISERDRDLQDARGVSLRQMMNLDFDYLEPRILELSNVLERPEIWKLWVKWKQEAKGT